MIINFFQPPGHQRTGGLDLAIQSLQEYLTNAGITVRSDVSTDLIGQSKEPELVHFHGLWQRRFPQISAHCRNQGVPYVVSPHGMLEPWAWRHKRWKKWPYFYLVERRYLAGAEHLVATSTVEESNLSKFFPKMPCTVLPLGLTSSYGPGYAKTRENLGWGESELVLLFLSRIHPKKNLNGLLEALAALGPIPCSRSVRLVIVGGGEDRYVRQLKGLANEHRNSLPRIDWVGEIWGEGKWPYLQGADLMCLPSFSENSGFSILEALQVGTRVLTTDQTPWSALPSWKAGWVVQPKVEDLVNALSAYFEKPDWPEEQRHGLAAQTRERYSWEKIGSGYIDFYTEIARRAS